MGRDILQQVGSQEGSRTYGAVCVVVWSKHLSKAPIRKQFRTLVIKPRPRAV